MDLQYNLVAEYKFLQPPEPPLNTKGLVVLGPKGSYKPDSGFRVTSTTLPKGAVPRSMVANPPMTNS